MIMGMKDLLCSMDFWALVVSICTMIGSFVGFLLYNRKINNLTLSALQFDEKMKNSANIDCRIQRDASNHQYVRVFLENIGLSVARDINIDIEQNDSIHVLEPSYLSHDLLQPNQPYEIQILVGDDDLRVLHINVEWADDNNTSRTKQYSLQI